MILFHAGQSEAQRNVTRFFLPNQFPVLHVHRRSIQRGTRCTERRYNAKPLPAPERCFPDRALLHDGHEIQHVAARSAGEALEDILGQMGTERVVAVAAMNRTAALQLIAMAAQPRHLVVARLTARFTAKKSTRLLLARGVIGPLPLTPRQAWFTNCVDRTSIRARGGAGGPASR